MLSTEKKIENMEKAADQYNKKIQLSQPPISWHPPNMYSRYLVKTPCSLLKSNTKKMKRYDYCERNKAKYNPLNFRKIKFSIRPTLRTWIFLPLKSWNKRKTLKSKAINPLVLFMRSQIHHLKIPNSKKRRGPSTTKKTKRYPSKNKSPVLPPRNV